MRRALLVPLVVLVAVAIGWAWSSVIWVGRDRGLAAWSPRDGVLEVPPRGLALLPRWRFERAPGEALLETRVEAESRDGVPVGVVVRFSPPVGSWSLGPAATAADGLKPLVEGPIRRHLAEIQAGCLLPGSLPSGCPPAPERALASWIASTLRAPESAVTLSLEPDAAAEGKARLAAVARGLERPGRKVLVLGLDALDWQVLEPMFAAGRLPNLERLRRAGTWGEMQTLVPMLSPLIWTSMATGVAPDAHGVLDFVERDPATGDMVPVSGRSRRVPAVWNIASAFGLSVGVVGWWATWPAERVNGVMVSDRLYYTLDQGVSPSALRVDPKAMVYPEELTERITGVRARAQSETDWQVVRHFMEVPEEAFDAAVASGRGMEDPVDGFRRILAATRTYLGVGLELAADQPDLLLVYLEGTDTIGHLLAPYQPSPIYDVDPAQAAVYTQAIPRYFEAVDRWVGRYLERCPLDRWTVVLLSDHGFKWGDDRPKRITGAFGAVAPMWHSDRAVFVLAGAGVERRGRVSGRHSVLEVAATLLTLLGLPPGAGWPAGVLSGCPEPTLDPVDYAALVPPSSYRQEVEVAAAVDDEAIAKLQALGYIAGSDAPTAGGPAAAPVVGGPLPAPTGVPASTTRGELNNLAVIKINAKEYGEAERLLRQAMAIDPSYPAPHYNLRRIYMEQGRWEDADRELWTAVDKGLRQPEESLNRAAGDYEVLRMEERAEAILVRALELFPEHEPTWVHLMVAKMRLEKCGEAAALGRAAVERFPTSAPAHGFYGLSAACAEDWATARREIARSLQLNPDQPTLRQTLADLPE